MSDRRTFLRSLAGLPLIGGGSTLIGQPTAAAVPVTEGMLDAYSKWLFFERRMLCIERFSDYRHAEGLIPMNTVADNFQFPAKGSWKDAPQLSTRAAGVLSAAGVPLG